MASSASPITALSATAIGAPDPRALSGFYRRLLDWETVQDSPDWVTIRPLGGGTGLSFQTEATYVAPIWPPMAGHQQMTMHLDFQVQDLDAAGQHAETCGAVLADYQPQEDVRVYLDPVGHPLCLFVPEASPLSP